MSDDKNEQLHFRMGDMVEATEELLQLFGEAHRRWVRSRSGDDNSQLRDAVATHCALKALSNAFTLEGLVSDPTSVKHIEEFIGYINVPIVDVDEEDDEPLATTKVAQA